MTSASTLLYASLGLAGGHVLRNYTTPKSKVLHQLIVDVTTVITIMVTISITLVCNPSAPPFVVTVVSVVVTMTPVLLCRVGDSRMVTSEESPSFCMAALIV